MITQPPKQTTVFDMEKHEDVAFKQRKKKAPIGLVYGGRGGGINIGGIVLWCGALAVASFAGAVVFKKGRKRRDADDRSSLQRKEEEAENETSQGLHPALQNSSPTPCNPCCASNGSTTETSANQIDSCKIDSTESLIIVEKTAATFNSRNDNCSSDNQEIFLADNSQEDDIKLSDNHTRINEFSYSRLDDPENGNKNYPAEKLLIKDEEARDVVNIDTEKTSLMHPVSVKEEAVYEGNTVQEVVKEVLPLFESIKVEEREEAIYDLKIPVDNASSVEVVGEEEGDEQTIKESPLVEGIDVWKDKESTDGDSVTRAAHLLSLMHSVEEKVNNQDNDDKEGEIKEDLAFVQGITTEEEKVPTHALKIYGDRNSSLRSVEEGDENNLKILPLMERIEAWKKEGANNGALWTSADMASIMHSVQEKEEEEEDEDESEVDISEKAKVNSLEKESTSTGSDDEEIWPEESIEAMIFQDLKNTLQYPEAKKMKEQTMKCKEGDGNLVKSSNAQNLNNGRNDHHTMQTPLLWNKEEPEIVMVNDQLVSLIKWRKWDWRVLVVALMVLLLLAHRSALGYFSS